MTLAGATEKELAAFEELHKKHADYIRGSLDVFKNKDVLPDDEFYQICKSFKKELIMLSNKSATRHTNTPLG